MTMSVCLSVCPRAYLRNYTSDLHQIFMRVTYIRGSVLLWRRCDTLSTSGFMDDVLFAHNGHMHSTGAGVTLDQPA